MRRSLIRYFSGLGIWSYITAPKLRPMEEIISVSANVLPEREIETAAILHWVREKRTERKEEGTYSS